jgi:predicted AlkP superfamily phosphohydrolase/phosphomutase
LARVSKVLILAVDSLNLEALRPHRDAGRMPNLERLFAAGTGGVLASTIPPHTAAAWNTLATGKNPGLHGLVNFRRWNPRTRSSRLNSTADLRHRTLWELLDAAGLNVGVVGQPMSWPLRPLQRGFAVSGFETPSTEVAFTWPPSLKDEVFRAAPKFRFRAERGEDDGFRGEWTEESDFFAGLKALSSEMENQHALNLHLAESRSWNVLFLYWQAPDPLFHKAWRWCDPETRDEAPRRAEAINRFFARLDEMLGEVLSLPAASAAVAFLCSDHGHGPVHELVRVNNLLADAKLLTRAGLGGQSREAWRRLTGKRAGKGLGIAVDWTRTRAYMPFEAICGFVYLNLLGREPEGLVKADDAEAELKAAAEKLRPLRSSLTDRPVFDGVDLGSALYVNRDALALAELVLRPARGVNFLRKLSFGSAFSRPPEPQRGTHRPEGVFAVCGGGARAGLSARAEIADLAPTILALLDQPIPKDMTGQALAYLFEDPPEIRFGPSSALDEEVAGTDRRAGDSRDGTGGEVYSAEEKAVVEQRLADLGYME